MRSKRLHVQMPWNCPPGVPASVDKVARRTDARDLALPAGYTDLFGALKERVLTARTRALWTV